MSKYFSVKRLHLIILLFGTLFLCLGGFNDIIWFDEAYSVALVRLPFFEMLKVGADDVHPMLYYIILWFVSRLPGGIMTMRIFSAFLGSAVAWLGFTHIRRDFGEKVGLWFSLITFILPCTLKYSLQIRMYSLAAVLVTLCAIYAYRFYRDGKRSELILMAVFSLLSAYTHHFALAAICFVNLFLFVAVIISRDKKRIFSFIFAAAAELACFVPGVLLLVHQVKMGGASGIQIKWATVFIDTLAFPFVGDMLNNASGDVFAYYPLLVVYGILFFGAVLLGLIFVMKNKTEHHSVALTSYVLFFSIFVAALIVSIFRPVYYERYMMNYYTFFVFPAAYLLGNTEFKREKIGTVLKVGVTVLLTAVCITRAVPVYAELYDESNQKCRDWMDERLREGDRVIFEELGGFNLSVYHRETPHYFYNQWCWNIEDAYKAFENLTVVRDLSCFEGESGRIWVHQRGAAYKILTEEYGFKETESAVLDQAYYGYQYTMVLLEK